MTEVESKLLRIWRPTQTMNLSILLPLNFQEFLSFTIDFKGHYKLLSEVFQGRKTHVGLTHGIAIEYGGL